MDTSELGLSRRFWIGILLALLAGTSESSQAQSVVATTDQGELHAADLDMWCQIEKRNCVDPKRRRLAAEDLIVQRALSDRFQQLELDSPSLAFQRRLLFLELAERKLRRALNDELPSPSTQALRAIHDQDPSDWATPKRWRLRNLFRRFPDHAGPKERAELQDAMESIRERAIQGEDFAALARQHSDSATRLRGGSIGLVSLERLDPAAASVVAHLGSGEVSEVIVMKGGLTLLKVDDVLPPREGRFDEVQETLRRRWRQDKQRQTRDELDQRLIARHQPRFDPPADEPAADPPAMTWRDGDEVRSVGGDEFALYLTRRHKNLDPTDAEAVAKARRDRFLLEARAREAEARGLVDDPEFKRQHQNDVNALEAQTAANVLAKDWIRSPTANEVRAAFDAEKDSLLRPRRRRLDLLEMKIETSRPATFYDDARRLGDQAAQAEITFEAVRDKLGDALTQRELGWLTDRQVWLLGLNIERGLRGLTVGGVTPWVQEGRKLHLVRLAAEEAERPLTFDEAEDALAAMLEKRSRVAAGRRLHDQMLADVAFHWVAPATEATSSPRAETPRP